MNDDLQGKSSDHDTDLSQPVQAQWGTPEQRWPLLVRVCGPGRGAVPGWVAMAGSYTTVCSVVAWGPP